MTDPVMMQALGRIEQKIDTAITDAREHRADDTRRFSELYGWLGRHDREIAKAKGGKAVILWLLGGGAVSLVALGALVFRASGHG